jgi:CheY-like chemotaxis protein
MSGTTGSIRVLLVDDDPLVRSGLRLMLGGARDIDVVGEAADGAQVPALVARHGPDVVLMDIRMPGVDGLTATENLRNGPRAPEVLVLTTFHADELVLRALRAGAAGYVLKDTPPQDIVAAVRKVSAGEPVLSPWGGPPPKTPGTKRGGRGPPTAGATAGPAPPGPGSGSPCWADASTRWPSRSDGGAATGRSRPSCTWRCRP